MDAELTVGFLSLKESYVSKVTCQPYQSVEVGRHVPCYSVNIHLYLGGGFLAYVVQKFSDNLAL